MTAGGVLDLVELAARATAAAQQWRSGVQLQNLRPLTGGRSSLTFVADAQPVAGGTTPVVLKVAPPGLEPVRNRDVLRQARLLRALAGRPGVEVPAVYFESAGDPPETPPLMGMSLVAGYCFEPVLGAPQDSPPHAEVRARALALARMGAALHSLAPTDIGLGDEPVTGLGEEIDRWTRAFATTPGELSTGYQQCAAALHASLPEPAAPVVNHGDFRLGNALCEGPRVAALIDWEIWTIGDPRVDLSWLMFFCDDARHPGAPSDAPPTGLPTGAELATEYQRAHGRPLADLNWFAALTRYKEAAATALLIKRARRTGVWADSLRRMEPRQPALIRAALELIT